MKWRRAFVAEVVMMLEHAENVASCDPHWLRKQLRATVQKFDAAHGAAPRDARLDEAKRCARLDEAERRLECLEALHAPWSPKHNHEGRR